jgi:Leucine-rich repeat (LRR) protein
MKYLTDDEIKYGYWYAKNAQNAVTEIKKCEDKDYLLLGIQAKDFKKWMDFLPTLSKLKRLHIRANINQRFFDTICDMTQLVELNISIPSVKNIDALNKLDNLTYLKLQNGTKVETIETLRQLAYLRVLELENFKKISDFDIVGSLSDLEGLGVEGSIWTTQKINSACFLSMLTKLKYLKLTNTKMVDKNFNPLLALRELRMLLVSYNYPRLEFEKLKSLPNLTISNVAYCLKDR